jgi:hypothetical protein
MPLPTTHQRIIHNCGSKDTRVLRVIKEVLLGEKGVSPSSSIIGFVYEP